MNGKKMLVKAWMVGFALCIATSVSAIQLRGNDYLGGGLDVYNWNDDNGFGRTYGGSIFINHNLEEDWDGYISYAGFSDRAKAGTEEIESNAILVGLNYLILPERLVLMDQPVTPYVGGSAGIVNSKVNDDTMTDAAFGVTLGAEWAVCHEAFLDINLFYSFVDDGGKDNDGDVGIQFSTGVEIMEQLIGNIGVSYTFDDEDALFHIGAIIEY